MLATYRAALLANTPFVESTWDSSVGSYHVKDFYVAAVFGNAVLLRYCGYDDERLLDHTIRSIRYAAGRNRWVDPSGEWGRNVYWDSTLETYFVGGAKLLWPHLDAATQEHIDTIIRSSADCIVAQGADSPHTNGLEGGYVGDTKMEEMGTRTMPLAVAMAWLPGDPHFSEWREWHRAWTVNMGGHPPADLVNPLTRGNTARNIYDTFISENHESWNPIYQQSISAYPGRNACHFLLAGQPLPDELRVQPNADELWETMFHLATDAGVAQDFMIDDRHHLYGRAVLPITARALLSDDPRAARAEWMLADKLSWYVGHEPAGRLTKFSGEPKYEPEARAEIAMAYLLHLFRECDVEPVSEDEFFVAACGAVDYGAGPGLVAHQTPCALAAVVTKPGYVKCAYLPHHDDWFVDVAGTSPCFLPSTDIEVLERSVRVYSRLRDGIDATATVLRTPTGLVSFTTLPDGSAVYVSTGIATGEGVIRVPGAVEAGTDWVDIDGRVRFVIRDSANPISIADDGVILSAGPPAPLHVEVQPCIASAAPIDAKSLCASLIGDHLCLVNLSDADVTEDIPTGTTTLFQGRQRVLADGRLAYQASVSAADAIVAIGRFTIDSDLPAGTTIDVLDSHTVRIDAPATLTSLATGETRAGVGEVNFARGLRTPTDDLARRRRTFPTTPLPSGMSNPRHAVDADDTTSWTPGAADRRLVVDLGAPYPIGEITTRWTGPEPAYQLETSLDGLTYSSPQPIARYVCVHVTDWSAGDGSLVELSVQ